MWPRAFAGIVAGFFLAAAATGLLAWLPPGPWRRALVPTLIAFIPLWMLAALWAFSFRSALARLAGAGRQRRPASPCSAAAPDRRGAMRPLP
jgi:hypothetical protein